MSFFNTLIRENASKIFSCSITIFLISCGGGGGGSSEPPLASINLSLSGNSQQEVGSNVTLSWSTSLAISCSASGDWIGSKDPQGTFSLALSSPKNYSFTLSCTNSAGKSSSKSVSVLANYSVVSGSIFNEINSGLEVFIDENHNRVMDVGEPSAISDSSGNFDIRIPNLNQSNMCLRDRPIFINDSHLMSLNPEKNTNINISSATSIFSDLVILSNETGESNSIFCDTGDNYERKRQLISFRYHMQRIQTYDDYSYNEIEGKSSIKNISDNRLLDISSFYTSINSIGSALVGLYKNQIDSNSEAQAQGFNSGDYSWSYKIDLDTSNFRIFLNDTSSYPNPSTDQSPQASLISEVSTLFDFALELSPSDIVPEANLNGWQDKYFFKFYGMHASNNNEIINSTENCYIGFNNVCKLDINIENIVEKSNPRLSFVMQKETSRGTEYIIWKESKNGYQGCDINASYRIKESNSNALSSISTYGFGNNHWDTVYNYEDNSCYIGYPINRFAWVEKKYNDGSSIMIIVDGDNIDSLPIIENPYNYLSNNLPPNQITSPYVDIFTQIPLIPEDEDVSENGVFFDIITDVLTNPGNFNYFQIILDSNDGMEAVFTLDFLYGNYSCELRDSKGNLMMSYYDLSSAYAVCSSFQLDFIDNFDGNISNRSPYSGMIQTSENSSEPMPFKPTNRSRFKDSISIEK